jgi:phage gpG-like protein
MAGSLADLQKLLNKAAEEIPDKLLAIFEVEGNNFIKKNFQDQGFNDNGIEKWKPRKTVDKKGRDLTRYRTSRHGSVGSFTKFGQENEGRAILTGHATGGNKLRNSFRSRREKQQVVFFTYKNYAERHNEGKDAMPRRQFIGKSTYLDKKIKEKVTKTLDQIFK